MSPEVVKAIVEGVVAITIAWLSYRTHRVVTIAHREHKEHEDQTRKILAALNGEAKE